MAGDGIEQIYAASHVRSVENAGLPYGFGDQGFGSEMHHGVKLVPRKDALQLRAVGEVRLAKNRARRHGVAMTLQQAVQGDDAHTPQEQYLTTNTSDVARSPGNENIHLCVLLEAVAAKDKWCSALQTISISSAREQIAPDE